jgi:hypothetical protein
LTFSVRVGCRLGMVHPSCVCNISINDGNKFGNAQQAQCFA